MTAYSAGDVALVAFPFSDVDSTKKRPALTLRATTIGRGNRLVTVAMITSQVDGLKLDGDVRLEAWEASGLLHPSLVRLAKVATIDAARVDKKLGRLARVDIDRCKRVFRELYRAWL